MRRASNEIKMLFKVQCMGISALAGARLGVSRPTLAAGALRRQRLEPKEAPAPVAALVVATIAPRQPKGVGVVGRALPQRHEVAVWAVISLHHVVMEVE